MRSLHGLMIVAAVAGCSDGGGVPGQMGSQSIVASSDGSALYVALTQEDQLAIHHLADGSVSHLAVGRGPTRVAQVADRLLVTLRGERALAVYRTDEGGGVELETKIAVGAEPYGVIAADEGRRAYVASSLSGRVDELDVDRKSVLRSWLIAGQPRWIAIHPRGTALYVASAFDGVLTFIDLGSGTARTIALPAVESARFEVGADGTSLAAVPFSLTPRLTGDPTVTPDGTRLLVPAIYVDNSTPVADHDETGSVALVATGYADRVKPVIVDVPLGGDGVPATSRVAAVPLQLTVSGGRGSLDGFVPVSYPTSVTVSPESDYALISLEASNAVLAYPISALGVSAEALSAGSGPAGGAVPVSRRSGAFTAASGLTSGGGSSGTLSIPGSRPGLTTFLGGATGGYLLAIPSGAGPRGIAFAGEGRAFVDAWLDGAIEPLDDRLIAGVISPNRDRRIGGDVRSLETGLPIAVASSALPLDIDRGRRLFYTANDGTISGRQSAVSCSTCHFEGRNDGLTWRFAARGPRQTPSLAGRVTLDAPVGWDGRVKSVADEAIETSMVRMGGLLARADGDAIAAFLDVVPQPDVERRGSGDARVERGRAIFERADVACSACHSGVRFTDNQPHAMFGLDHVKTRPLVGLASTPPYLHDGSAASIREVLERARGGAMGNVDQLTSEELDDLTAYLESL